MKLYEFEGHRILAKVGIVSPFFVVASDIREVKQARKRFKFPIVAKVQVLAGRRGKSGGIKICTTEKQLLDFAKEKFGNSFNDEKVRFLMLAEKVDIEKEFYMSITYDTVLRTPFLLFSEHGGVNIEEISKSNPEAIKRVDIDPLQGPNKKDLEKTLSHNYSSSEPFDKSQGKRREPRNWIPDQVRNDIAEKVSSRLRSNTNEGIVDFAMRLWDAFWRYDCRLIEVNPLALTYPRGVVQSSSRSHPGGDSGYVAIDAKIILDDSGFSRHKDFEVVAKGAISAVPSKRELLAKEIDAEDYRGSAGSTFIELDGDIAILASGGGASLLVMDSVVAAGGKPANYTEYSGNPPAEKVEKLTKITLSREGISGCLVAGAVANFTDIYETLSGFVEGLRQVRPKPLYPIVIRRGGPRQKEAYEMLRRFAKKEGFDIYLFGPETPISVACRKAVELAKEYKIRNTKFEINEKRN